MGILKAVLIALGLSFVCLVYAGNLFGFDDDTFKHMVKVYVILSLVTLFVFWIFGEFV